MALSTIDLCTIMRAGGGVKLDAARFSTIDLTTIAKAGAASGAMLVVTNAVSKSTIDLCTIAKGNPGKVLFE